jgi:hypothetical protein
MSKEITYIIKTDPNLPDNVRDEFFTRVPQILNSDKRWIGYNFKYLSDANSHNTELTPPKKDYDVIITLLDRKTKHKVLIESNSSLVDQPKLDGYGKPINFSAVEFSYTFYTSPAVIIIDEGNWSHAHEKLLISKKYYEEYVIFHEIGHAIGKEHKPIPSDVTKPYPIMYQATLGLPDLKRFLPYPNESD